MREISAGVSNAAARIYKNNAQAADDDEDETFDEGRVVDGKDGLEQS